MKLNIRLKKSNKA